MSRQFNAASREVAAVETALRRIGTPFPPPGAVQVIETLRAIEPVAMQGQPPVVWDRAEGFQVFDRWGNRWIDWSSGVLVANAGHGRKEIVDAIVAQASGPLLTNYCFPSEVRARLLSKLVELLPEPLKKVFLLTTGSETVECAIKLCRSWGVRAAGPAKHVVVSYTGAFHGRTLGSQQAGGIPALKEWIVNLDRGFVQLPFPEGSFETFESELRERGVDPANVCGVLLETYQGGSAAFAPVDYMHALRQWCTRHNALLVLDEVQAGFGRCGTLWGWEHYGVVPDVACFGKGISSSLPLSAVAGRADVIDLHPPNSMTSTHTGNPLSCAAALASIDLILGEDLVGNARRMGDVLQGELHVLQRRFPCIGRVEGRGLVAGVACIGQGGEPDADLAWKVVERSIEKGVLMFAPVGRGGATIKICPPLTITEEALRESLHAFAEAFAESVS